MNVSEYKLLASTGVVAIHLGYVGLFAGEGALGATVFALGACLTVYAAAGALFFTGPWEKPKSGERHSP
ncbi:MAG TPA: hypothetical protein VGE12_17955 [Noviherbaspirillum sp.]